MNKTEHYVIHYIDEDNCYCSADCNVLEANSEHVIVKERYYGDEKIVTVPTKKISNLFSPGTHLQGRPENTTLAYAQINEDTDTVEYVCDKCGHIMNEVGDECPECRTQIYDVDFMPTHFNSQFVTDFVNSFYNQKQ